MIRNVFSNLLFVGNARDVRTLRMLYDKEIRAVIDLAINEKPAQLGRDMIYCRFPIGDGDGNADAMLALTIRTTVSLLRDDTRTLVACSGGMSRAPSVAAICISALTGNDPDECLMRVIQDGPNDVSPVLWTHLKRVYNDLARPDHAATY